MAKTVVQADHLTKIYPLYDKKSDRLREAFSRKKRHRDFYALKDISFSVGEGENVGFIGQNGSGKSTLLKVLTGVLTPSQGAFKVDGSVSALLELGAGFNYEYTGIENIYLNGSLMGFDRHEMDERMEDILSFADIGDFVYQPVKMYSSGMFVRLAFAVAINVDPDVLIVDEALSVGDIFFQNKCYKKFEDFRDAGKTILFVTHDLNSVIKYCDRAYLLNLGEIITTGTPREVVDKYKKLMSGIDIDKEEELEQSGMRGEALTESSRAVNETSWRSNYAVNKAALSYGDKELEIVDYGIFDETGKLAFACEKGSTYTIKMKVKANQTVERPIFALTIKDIKGTEIAGTNTFMESVDTGIVEEGETVTVSFTQQIDLQGATFFLSFGCTRFVDDGSLKVYHRLYDIMELSMIYVKQTTGFVDLNSEIGIERSGE